MTDAELAAHLADYAGRLLVTVRESGVFSPKALGKAGDAAANEFLVHALREVRPDDGLLSEEEKDNFDRLAFSRAWIVDPVDGTREYGEARADWAVHVGLAIDGVASIGAVALPGAGLVLRTDQPREVPPAPEKLRMVVSRTRPAREAVAVADKLGAERTGNVEPHVRNECSNLRQHDARGAAGVKQHGGRCNREHWRRIGAGGRRGNGRLCSVKGCGPQIDRKPCG